MGKLSTHVLDLLRGRPAAGMKIELRSVGETGALLKSLVTNADGRTDAPLLAGAALAAGEYEITFHVGDYFGESVFLDRVPVRFRVSDPPGTATSPCFALHGPTAPIAGVDAPLPRAGADQR